MLVLSRQRDETIMIGDDIEVTVVDIRGDKVRLGITAPKEISVHRKEVYDAIKRENRAAAQVKPEDLSGLGKVAPKGTGTGASPGHGSAHGPGPSGASGPGKPEDKK
jgi:carbon storage regulator